MSTPGEPQHILLVEDEAVINEAVRARLEQEGYVVSSAADGQEALDYFKTEPLDLIILDLMLPKISGERVCKTIREESDIPIIMLTAKANVADRICGLELGADDYLVKPFSPRELVARVKALLRRAYSDNDLQRDVLDFGDLIIDVTGHKIILDGKEIEVTASEFKLLSTIARYPGRVYSRMELVESVLGYDYAGYERTIDSHMKNLRAKLHEDPKHPRFLYTVHGVGYKFDLPTSARKKGSK